jgi:histidinol-phosphate aminotransferase
VPERKKLNAAVRADTFTFRDRSGYSYTPSASNCFMLDTKRPTKEIIEAMAARNAFYRARLAGLAHSRFALPWAQSRDGEIFQAAFRR